MGCPCKECSYFDGVDFCIFQGKPTTPDVLCWAKMYEFVELCESDDCAKCIHLNKDCVGDKKHPARELIERFHYGQGKALSSEGRIILISAGKQSGKCIRGDVILADGTLKFVGDIERGDKVLSLDESLKITHSKVLNKIVSGILPVFKITTWSGRQLEISETHPLLTKDGWKPFSDISEGDFIGVPRNYPELGVKRYDSNMLKILGYLLGDGGLTSKSVMFSTASKEIKEDLTSCLPIPCKLKHNGKYDYRITGYGRGISNTNPVLEFIKATGLHRCDSYTKFIPKFVFELINEDISLVINRLFACDGWVDAKGIGYCSVSKQMIYQVQHLLLRFGILSRIRYRKVKFQNGISFAYELTINPKSELVKFQKQIGIFSKDEKLDKLIKSKPKEKPQDVIPVDISNLYILLERDSNNHLVHQKDRIRYESLRRCRVENIERIGLQEVVKWFEDIKLKQLSESDIYWDTIKEIAYLGELPCWDLEIEGTHNYIANDIFAHNTSMGALWMYHQMQIHGDGDYLAVSSSFPLMDKKLIPSYLDFFCGIGLSKPDDFLSAKKILKINGMGLKANIFFGSAKNASSLESSTALAAHLDEAGQDEFSSKAYDAVLGRLSRSGGKILITTTVYNLDWLYHRVYLPFIKGDPDYDVIQFESIMSPGFSKTQFEWLKKKIPAWQFDREYRGLFSRPTGMIYSDFRDYEGTDGHLIKPFTIPNKWNWHVGIDPGAVHTALVWVVEEPATNKYFIVTSSLEGNRTTKEHVKKAMQYYAFGKVIRWVGGAGSEDQFRMDWTNEGIHVREPEIRDVEAGIDRVTALLREKRLFIFNTDENARLIEEMRSYSRELDDRGQPTDRIKDKNLYHGLDSVRYFAVGIGNAGDYSTPVVWQDTYIPSFDNTPDILREDAIPQFK